MASSTFKTPTFFFIFILSTWLSFPPPVSSCHYHPNPGCSSPSHHPPNHHHQPPHHSGGGGGGGGGGGKGGLPPVVVPPIIKPPPVIIPPPVVNPPVINPPPVIIPPPVVNPPPSSSPPCPPGSGGGGTPGKQPPAKCPINALKLGLCLDVLGGLVHVGIGKPAENVCCPVLKDLLELEAAVCLCTTIRLKLLNLNIFLPLALQVLATCGQTPPPGFVCPPLA